jgi:hypothetical protein
MIAEGKKDRQDDYISALLLYSAPPSILHAQYCTVQFKHQTGARYCTVLYSTTNDDGASLPLQMVGA